MKGYKSDHTGVIINDGDAMVTVKIWDGVAQEYVERYVKDLVELKEWWLAGKPHNGGEIEISSHYHQEVTDPTKKITVEWDNQTFVFANLAEAADWHDKHSN